MTYLLSKHRPKNKKLLNWALELSKYEFDIVHIPSKFNTISDCLSHLERICSVLQMPSLLSKQALLSTQENDREIQEAIKYLKQGKRDFPVQQLGTLRRFHKQLQLDTNGLLLWKTKIVIPTQLRPEIL